MSRAHFPHRNLPWEQMLKLLCYNTEKPELLSKKQMVTRLYKNVLRTDYDNIHRAVLVHPSREFFRNQVNHHRAAFSRMLELDRQSIEFKNLIDKYEKYMDEFYDPSMLIFDNQLHSLNSNKLYIFTDEVYSTGSHVRPIRLLQGT